MFSPRRLQAHRRRRDLTRSQLHQELIILGLRPCRAMIDRWEKGRVEPHASELEALAQVLQVDLSAFFEPAPAPTSGEAAA